MAGGGAAEGGGDARRLAARGADLAGPQATSLTDAGVVGPAGPSARASGSAASSGVVVSPVRNVERRPALPSMQLEDENRLSTLTDYILLSILGTVSLCIAASTCVLSTWWRHLPWLLAELSIEDFLFVRCNEPVEEDDMKEAMVSLTNATRSFLTDHQRQSTISSLHLTLYLINTSLCEIGSVVGEATESGLLKDLDLTILDETKPVDRSDEEMLQRAREISTFFSAYPSVLCCLTKLSLYNADFNKLDMHHVLFDCCKQLKHLSLCYCDTGAKSVFKIDAPNSKLCVQETDKCCFERIDLVCLPKLEKFVYFTWDSQYIPVTFRFVPSLGN